MSTSRITRGLPVKHLLMALLFLSCSSSVADEPVSTEILWTSSGMTGSISGRVEASDGLPEDMMISSIVRASNDTVYIATFAHGLFKKTGSSDKWINISSNDWKERSIYGKTNNYRKVSALAVSNTDPRLLACATKHTLYMSRDEGRSWNTVSMRGLPPNVYITSLALNGTRIIVGTSFKGIFMRSGNRFVERSRGLPFEPYSRSLSFFEEIGPMHVATVGEKTRLFAGTFFTGELYSSDNSGRSWTKMNVPWDKASYNGIHDIQASGTNLLVSCKKGVYLLNMNTQRWNRVYSAGNAARARKVNTPYLQLLHHEPSGLRIFHQENVHHQGHPRLKQNSARAVYAGAPVSWKRVRRTVALMKKTGLNAMVIDIKDDVGNVYAAVENEQVRKTGALRKGIPVKKLNNYLQENGIYSIARIVVFKDRNLYRSFDNRYAIWNRRAGVPWKGVKGEYWVDPYSKFVQEYNIDISRQVSKMGFDEIQFDYIRFPVDGPTHLCRYRFRPDAAMYKSEVLMDYLRKASAAMDTPVSVDVYGFNGWYHFGNWIGQDIEAFSTVVDVICPMVYPSHFGNRFLMDGPRAERPYRIVHASGVRANMLSRKAVIRPYIQAFNMLSPTWGPDYIRKQVQAVEDSNCMGYTFWNAAVEYTTVEKALAKD